MRLRISLLAIIILAVFKLDAQQHSTLHELEMVPNRLHTNPAFVPKRNFHFGFPILSRINVDYANSGFAWNHFFTKESDDSLLLDPDKFVSKLHKRDYILTQFETDIIFVGFRVKKTFWNLNITSKNQASFMMPKSMFELALQGNGPFIGETIDLSGLAFNATNYMEYGLNGSYELNDKLTIGAKLKLLQGGVNIYTRQFDASLTTQEQAFQLETDVEAEFNMSGFGSLFEENQDFDPTAITGFSNIGFGADLGATYQLDDQWSFSGSIMDIGFIRWTNDITTLRTDSANFTFEGIDVKQVFNQNDTLQDLEQVIEDLADSIVSAFNIDTITNAPAYSSPIMARFYFSGHYDLNEMHRFGAILHGHMLNKRIYPSATLSYLLRIKEIFHLNLNYSMLNRSFNNLGAGFSLTRGPVQLYVASDNILAPFTPEQTHNAQLEFGINFMSVNKQDMDKDGIKDKHDKCPEIAGLKEFDGCPDTDGDGIIDSEDKCPTVSGPQENKGCPWPDTDTDGIYDKDDVCPEVAGIKAFDGCPDTDEDGVQDSEDKCVDVPGSKDQFGCPDTDGDGIYDHEDDCINEKGIEENKGCPWPDTDGDSVFDKDDECPKTPGTVANNGCPEIDEEEQEVIDYAFENLEFENGKAIIRSSSYESLNKLATLLKDKTTYKLQIDGHTDSVGSEVSNQKLSEDRANAVKKQLTDKGVNSSQLMTKGYGESKPIDTNDTAAGRQNNRRVEMEIVFD